MVEGEAASDGMASVTVLISVAIALEIAVMIVARLVGSIFGVPSSVLVSLAIGDASPNPLTFADTFPLTMLG